jgi:hypothetical protein
MLVTAKLQDENLIAMQLDHAARNQLPKPPTLWKASQKIQVQSFLMLWKSVQPERSTKYAILALAMLYTAPSVGPAPILDIKS